VRCVAERVFPQAPRRRIIRLPPPPLLRTPGAERVELNGTWVKFHSTMDIFRLSQSPFGRDGAPRVGVASGKGPYGNARDALSGFDLSPAKGKRVLLKPNAGRAAAVESGICTHPEVVAAAIDAFREAGAEVAVGESPISGVSTMDALESTGIAAAARKRNCPLIDMDERKPILAALPGGVAIKSLKICPEIAEFDIIVSIPVMKTHMHTGVTLAVKNMKGCLWRRSKVVLHMLPRLEGIDEKPLDVAICDMSEVLRPHFSLIDGTVGMEGLGPSAGNAKPLGVVVASADAFAADAVACRLMEIDPASVPHLRLGAERGIGTLDLDEIEVSPDNWRSFSTPFSAPPNDLKIEFPDVDILDVNSCSACQSTLTLFLRRYEKELKEYLPGDATIAIGAGHDDIPPGTICVGNCIRRELRDKGVFIPGCPPVGSEILSAVTGTPSVDVRDGNAEAPEDDGSR